jgi:uncharacterized membrane protein YjgN (DUF898 family)
MMIVAGLGAAGLLMLAIGLGAATHGRFGGAGTMGFVAVIGFYGALLAAGPFVSARIQNTVWSNTRLEGVGFSSDVGSGRLVGITLTNLAMIVVSLGLLIPFALMRLMKYKVEAIEVLDSDALGRFVSERKDAGVGSAGEGAVDVMDLDFGL